MFYYFRPFTGQDEPDTIGPEGVEKLCKDLGVDPEDVRYSCGHVEKCTCSENYRHSTVLSDNWHVVAKYLIWI